MPVSQTPSSACNRLFETVDQLLNDATRFPQSGEQQALTAMLLKLAAIADELTKAAKSVAALPKKILEAAISKADGASDVLLKAVFQSDRQQAISEAWSAIAALDQLV